MSKKQTSTSTEMKVDTTTHKISDYFKTNYHILRKFFLSFFGHFTISKFEVFGGEIKIFWIQFNFFRIHALQF